MVNWSNLLPDFKGALKGFYEENIAFGQRTQKIAIALGIGIFLLLAIAYFWQGKSKYLALGVLTGYLLPYIYHLIKENN